MPSAPKLEVIMFRIKNIRDNINSIMKSNPEFMDNHPIISSENRENYSKLIILRNEYIDNMSSYLADSDLYPYIKCWKVIITGRSELSEEDVKTIKYDNNILVIPQDVTEEDYVNKIISKATGVLGNSIRSFLIENKFRISDASTTKTDWTIGFYCTEEESHRLCKAVHNKFKKALDAQLFKIQRGICEPEFVNP